MHCRGGTLGPKCECRLQIWRLPKLRAHSYSREQCHIAESNHYCVSTVPLVDGNSRDLEEANRVPSSWLGSKLVLRLQTVHLPQHLLLSAGSAVAGPVIAPISILLIRCSRAPKFC